MKQQHTLGWCSCQSSDLVDTCHKHNLMRSSIGFQAVNKSAESTICDCLRCIQRAARQTCSTAQAEFLGKTYCQVVLCKAAIPDAPYSFLAPRIVGIPIVIGPAASVTTGNLSGIHQHLCHSLLFLLLQTLGPLTAREGRATRNIEPPLQAC